MKFPIVPPRKATIRGPSSGGGTCCRWRSKSPTMPWTSRPSKTRRQLVGDAHDHRLGHVDRDVAAQRSRRRERAEQHARLLRGPGAQLDDLGRARGLRDARGLGDEDRALGARRVVLGQLADPVEQLRADRVVEVLGRQLLERARQPVEDVVGERALVARRQVRVGS